MQAILRDVDLLLRGHYTNEEELRAGRIRLPVAKLVLAGATLGALYGAFMGLYASLGTAGFDVRPMLATAAKVPLLFLLTLAVTFPSLYVASALGRSRLGSTDMLRLMLIAIAINMTLLASLGPVVAFFTLSTNSYPFMALLNVLFFGVSGAVGFFFLQRALRAVFGPARVDEGGDERHEEEDKEDALPKRGEHKPSARRQLLSHSQGGSQLVFRVWAVLYGVVGAQMAWIMRPFIGAPDLPFELFRERESNFFGAVLEALRLLITG